MISLISRLVLFSRSSQTKSQPMFLLQKRAAENIYWVEAFSLLSQIFPVWRLSVYRASLVQLALFVCESLNWNLSRFFSELVFVPFINSDLRYAGFSSIELSIIQPVTSNTYYLGKHLIVCSITCWFSQFFLIASLKQQSQIFLFFTVWIHLYPYREKSSEGAL